MVEPMSQDEPQVGDFIVLFDADSDDAGEPPILVVRVTEDGYSGIGEGRLDQADRLEAHARFLALEHGVRAWRHVGERYALLPPYDAPNDVH